MLPCLPCVLGQRRALEGVASAFVSFLEDAEKCRFLLDSPGEEAWVVQTHVLVDVGADGKWHGPQAPRCGYLLDGNGKKHVRRVAVAPTTAGIHSMLIYPRSHKVLRQAAKHHEWQEDWGFTFSSNKKDEEFCAKKRVRKPWRIWLERGHMLVYDGHLVYAEDQTKIVRNQVLPNMR